MAWDSQPHNGPVREEVFAAYAAKIADLVRSLAE